MSEYHADFWITLATAAPVIGLAHVLAYGRYIKRIPKYAKLANGPLMRYSRPLRFIAGTAALLPFAAASGGTFLCSTTFATGLDALRAERDGSRSLDLAQHRLTGAFFILILQYLLEAFVPQFLDWLGDPDRVKQRRPSPRPRWHRRWSQQIRGVIGLPRRR